MSAHNICFTGEIRKIICGYPLLSGAKQNITISFTRKYFFFSIKTEL